MGITLNLCVETSGSSDFICSTLAVDPELRLALFYLQLILAQMILGRRNELGIGQGKKNKFFFTMCLPLPPPPFFLVSVGKPSEIFQGG